MRFTLTLLISLGLACVTLRPAAAQAPETVASYREARRVLSEGAEALGGAARLFSLKSLEVERRGWWTLRNQSRGAEPPRDSIPQGDGWAIDLARGWAAYDNHSGAQGIGAFNTRSVIKGESRLLIDTDLKTIQAGTSGPLASPLQIWYYVPALVVRRALERAATARWLGTTDLGGRPNEMVTFGWQDGVDLTLYFDRQTKLLTKTERLFADYEFGDTVQEYWFEQYYPVGGIQMPKQSAVTAGGTKTLSFLTTAAFLDRPIDSAIFAAPSGLRAIPAPAEPNLTQVGPGLWYFQNGQAGYNTAVAEFADHLMLFEAPVGNPYSAQLLTRLRTQFPTKPIRTVVLSHQHWDHIAGLSAFAAQGATVVTSVLARPTIDRVLQAKPTVVPDPLAGKTRTITISELKSGERRVIEDSTQAVELINVGPTPHVNELVVAYFPKSKTLFAADWLRVSRDGPIDRDSPATQHFLETLAKLGREVVQVLDVHGRRVEAQELTPR